MVALLRHIFSTPGWQRLVTGLILLGILFFALFLRLYRIEDESLHPDEVTTLTCVYEHTFSDAYHVARRLDPPMAPLYFLFEYVWSRTVGLTVLRMHLLSALFSAAALLVVYLIGSELHGRLTGLIAAALLAVSPIHVYYSLEIRNYSITFLLGALSLYTLIRAVARPGRRAWTLNCLVDLLLGMSHLFANLLFVPQAVFLLACHRRRVVLLPWGAAHLLVVLVVCVWLGTCDIPGIRVVSGFIPTMSWGGVREMCASLAGAPYCWGLYSAQTSMVDGAMITLLLLGILTLAVNGALLGRAGAAAVDRRVSSAKLKAPVLIFLTLVIPPLVLVLMTYGYAPCFLPRYVLYSAVAAPLLFALSVTAVRSSFFRLFMAVSLVLLNTLMADAMFHNRPQRSTWIPLTRFLRETVKPEDRVFVFGAPFITGIEMLAPFSPKQTTRKDAWTQFDLDELQALHKQGVQTWCLKGPERQSNAEFETLLGSHNLPFSKHVFRYLGEVVYRIPVGENMFSAPDSAVSQAPLGSGGLRGWFVMDRMNEGNGMGITWLASGEHPYAPIFARPSLSLQTITKGRLAQEPLLWDAAQAPAPEVCLSSTSRADVHRQVTTSMNPLDCRIRYASCGKNAMDILFETTCRGEGDCLAPITFSWASYVRGACVPTIHFPGARDGVEGWVSFGGSPSERGAVARMGLPEEEWERAGAMQGCRPVRGVRFSEPGYYGLVDGDQNEATDGDMMAFILMFEHPEDIRFVLRDSANDSRTVEWDWQYVLRAPEAGKTYSQRARMVYKPFLGQDDVLAEYHSWRDVPPSMDGSAVDAQVSPLAIPGRDDEECDPVGPVDRLAEMDPQKALDAYEALLEIPLYRLAAAKGIDACYMRGGDPPGLAAQWESIAGRRGDAFSWGRLGSVCHRMGDTEKAAMAFARGVEKDAENQECRMGLAAIRFEQGNIGEAVGLAAAVVTQNPELAKQAADLCATAARRCLAAGDTDSAETTCRAALQFVPEDASSKIFLARLLASRGKIENGLDLLGETISANPGMTQPVADACKAITEACLKSGDARGAAMVLRRAIACPPNDPDRRMALGQALEAAKDDEGALAEYLAAMGESPESEPLSERIDAMLKRRGDPVSRASVWQRLVDACPHAALPQLHLCLALEAAGDMAGAETACQVALKDNPGNGPAKIHLGKLRAARGDTGSGLALIEEAVSARPQIAGEAAELCAAAAKTRLEAGDSTGAAVVLKCACSLVPATCQYAVNRAGVLEAVEDMAGAEAAYRDALKCDPRHVPAKIRLGALLVARGDINGGRELIDEAVSSAPGEKGQAAEACAAAAKRRMQVGDAPGAVAEFRQALSFTPSVLGYRADLAAALEAAGDSAAALDEYNAVVEQAPESPKSSVRIDAILDGRGDGAARLAEWERMVAGHPDAAIPNLHLGLALEALGDIPGARAAYGRVLEINPNLAEARTALDRINGNGTGAK